MVALHHFYHCYSGTNSIGVSDTWKPILNHHLNSLINSKLINNLDKVHIGITSNTNNFDEVKSFINQYSIPYTVVSEDNKGWEQQTMTKLYEFSQVNDGYVLYAHSKGGYNDIPINRTWRESMTYFTVTKWKEAVEKLSDYDAVGCYWYDDSAQKQHSGQPHQGQRWFAGTFWWTKLDMLRQTPGIGMATRWDAEVWIGKIPSDKIFDLDAGRSAGCPPPD